MEWLHSTLLTLMATFHLVHCYPFIIIYINTCIYGEFVYFSKCSYLVEHPCPSLLHPLLHWWMAFIPCKIFFLVNLPHLFNLVFVFISFSYILKHLKVSSDIWCCIDQMHLRCSPLGMLGEALTIPSEMKIPTHWKLILPAPPPQKLFGCQKVDKLPFQMKPDIVSKWQHFASQLL